jgi:hypothetical protein
MILRPAHMPHGLTFKPPGHIAGDGKNPSIFEPVYFGEPLRLKTEGLLIRSITLLNRLRQQMCHKRKPYSITSLAGT